VENRSSPGQDLIGLECLHFVFDGVNATDGKTFHDPKPRKLIANMNFKDNGDFEYGYYTGISLLEDLKSGKLNNANIPISFIDALSVFSQTYELSTVNNLYLGIRGTSVARQSCLVSGSNGFIGKSVNGGKEDGIKPVS